VAAGFKTKTEAWKFQREREAEAVGLPKFRRWWITYKGERLYEISVYRDGTITNPNGYPEDLVRAACAARKAEKHARRSEGAKKAAVTRAERAKLLVKKIAMKIVAEEVTGPRELASRIWTVG
jgi:hypothetical protein